MKKALIIIIIILMLPEIALLVYGAAFLGKEVSSGFDMDIDLVAPDNPRQYAPAIAEWARLYHETNNHRTLYVPTNPSKNPEAPNYFAPEVDGWYDVFGEADPSQSMLVRHTGADLAANIILPVTYNHNRVKQYKMIAHYEIAAKGQKSVSDIIRVRYQPEPARKERYYFAACWTGSAISPVSLSIEFENQKLESKGTNVTGYDAKTNTYTYNLKKRPSKETRPDQELEREVPFKAYDMLCIPIYLGGGDSADTDYYAQVDSSVIDGSTVCIQEPTEENRYYVLTFSEDLQQAQRSENKEDRLNAAFSGRMDNLTIKKADFMAEIWECGLFRQIRIEFLVNAKINGSQGDAKITMVYKFVYDDDSCDMVRLIENVGWQEYLSNANKAKLQERKRDIVSE